MLVGEGEGSFPYWILDRGPIGHSTPKSSSTQAPFFFVESLLKDFKQCLVSCLELSIILWVSQE